MPTEEKTSFKHEDTQLLTVFQTHFSGILHLSRIHLICLLISSLCKVRSVNFAKLSSGFETSVDSSINYRRIQRFLSHVNLPI
jgi:hypothetical protein